VATGADMHEFGRFEIAEGFWRLHRLPLVGPDCDLLFDVAPVQTGVSGELLYGHTVNARRRLSPFSAPTPGSCYGRC